MPSVFEDMIHPDDLNVYLQSRCKQLQGTFFAGSVTYSTQGLQLTDVCSIVEFQASKPRTPSVCCVATDPCGGYGAVPRQCSSKIG